MGSKLLIRYSILLIAVLSIAGQCSADEITNLRTTNANLASENVALKDEIKELKKPELLDLNLQSIVWVLVIFIVLAWILYKKAWKNVLAGLKGREERIRSDLAQAEAARLNAEASLKDYNAKLSDAESRGREILAKATSDALGLAERIKTDADKAAHERAERAAKDIADARDQALRDIYEQAADLSTSIAEKILRRSLNANDQRDLVAQSLEQMQALNRG